MSLENNFFKINNKFSQVDFLKSKNRTENYGRYKKKFNSKLKLPPIPKASDDVSFHHEIWRSDVEYNKVKDRIISLKGVLSDDDSLDLDVYDDTESKITEGDETRRTDQTDTSVTVDDILLLDEKIERSLLEFDEIKSNRIREQNSICKQIQLLDSCPFEKRNSQTFLKICKYKKEATKKKNVHRPKFTVNIRKNSKLCRPKSQLPKSAMGTVTLTDEEKVRIQTLLADIDDDDAYDIDDTDVGRGTNSMNFENGFILNDVEKMKLDSIQEQLKVFIDTVVIREAKNKIDEINYEQINWREIKNLSVKEIDKALEEIKKDKANMATV